MAETKARTLADGLVVKNGSKMRASCSAAMPLPVSVIETAAKRPGAEACPRMAGKPLAQSSRRVSVPSPSMASRAFTAMLISAVSNWLRSACTKQGASGTSVTT